MQENIKRALNESVWIRWAALLMISLTMFASYYFYDIFSAIKSTLQAEVGLSNADYGAWYGAYSLFNAFGMALIGGIILDKWGIRRTGIIFISFLFSKMSKDYFDITGQSTKLYMHLNQAKTLVWRIPDHTPPCTQDAEHLF